MAIDDLSFEMEDAGEEDNSLPSYFVSANNHNIGNKNIDMTVGGEERSLGNRVYNMVGAAAVSGINSFYNTALWAGNWFSDEGVQYRDAKDVMAEFDEDMAKYYGENRQTADILGLVLTSFIPGLGGVKVFQGGVKVLNLAKEGTVGANMAKGLGILPGSRQALVKEATNTFATSRLPFSYAQPEVIKAIGAGFGQAALESLAFETAVAVTMKKNPILTDLDFGQTVSNIAMGGALGGAIGGTFSGVLSTYGIKKGIKELDKKLAPVNQLDQGAAGTRTSDSLLILRNDLDTTPLTPPQGVDPTVWNVAREGKWEKADNKSRELFTKLAGDDASVGNALADGFSIEPTSSFAAKVLGLEGIRPVESLGNFIKGFTLSEPKLPKLDKASTRYWYKQGDATAFSNRLDDATHFVDVPNKLANKATEWTAPQTGGVPIPKQTHQLRYLKLWGENAGKMSDEAPTARHLADLGEVSVSSNLVQAGKHSWKISTKELFDPSAATYEEALARNIWAMDTSVERLRLTKNQTYLEVHANDIPTLTKAYREGFTDLRIVDGAGVEVLRSPQKKQLLEYIAQQKDHLTQQEMLRAVAKPGGMTAEQVANKYDTPLGFVTGEQYATNLEQAVFGLKNAQRDWYNKHHANTPRPPAVEDVKPWMKPQNYGMVYDANTAGVLNGFQVEAMATIRARQEIYKASANNAAASVLGKDKFDLIPELTEAELQRVNRAGAGPGMASYSNAALGSIAQKFELVGSLVTKWAGEAATKVSNTFQSVNYQILNSQADSATLFAVLQKVRAAGSHMYVPTEGGLVLKSVRDFEAAGGKGMPPQIPSHIDEFIPVDSAVVMDWLYAHRDLNAARVTGRNNLRNAQGLPSDWNPEVIYSPQPNPDKFKFHAFVVDDGKVVSQGDTSMLYATDAAGLEKQMAEARAQGFSVYTPNQSAQYYRARGLYDHSLSMSESRIDSVLRSSGSSAPAFPFTGTPQDMLQDMMQWHARQEGNLIREAVSTKYWREFGIIKEMGKQYEEVANARVGFFNRIQKDVPNPYQDYIKLALGTSLKNDYPMWATLNDFVENVGSKVYGAVSKVWRSSSSPYDIDQVNSIFKQYGLEMPATKAQLEAWTNHPAGKKAVTEFIQTQNAVLSSLVLRLDPVNALNNAIGSPILTLTETNSWIRNAYAGNSELAGELAKLINITVPGTTDTIRSPLKLMASAYKNYFSKEGKELLEKYRKLNVVSDYSAQFKNLLEDATLTGTETAAELASKRARIAAAGRKLVDTGEKWTGNKLAEEMNRFVSANIADQLTAPLVKAGMMDAKSAGVYINTFVNRTQGNIIASQRPQMFQGPVGQAIGLFQSYQFNIMQQLLRHVGEGSKKDAIMLMGLQGSIYGMNGLPGFQAINQHVIGTASGNTNHVDAYSATYNIAGKTAGDWLMYGAASNMMWDPDLKINLYSRGDISPRQLTIVPSQFSDIPVVAAYTKLYGALKGMLQSAQGGGDVWNTLLGGIEQQGVSRPLAGLARVARGLNNEGVSYSASGRGNIISANDMYSLANLARVSGAKPFDEAIAQDATFRIQAYQATDARRKETVGKAVRTVLTGGGTPTEEQMTGFMEGYVKAGGKQEEFSKWYVQQLRAATVPQANKIIAKTESPYSQYLQSLMDGRLMATPADILNSRAQEEGDSDMIQ